MSGKLALIIGNSEYEDRNLAQLVTPDADVNALAEILRDPEIGGFDEVVALVNQPATANRRAIAAFFAGRGRDDLLLLYFSGHGVRDDRGQLFLAVKDTEYNLLRGTAIPAAYITDEMDNSRSRRQVLILDCCHSGAFSRGMKGTPGASVGTAAAFEGTGSGRVVLTATDSTQYAWEGDRVIGQAENSVFTHYLIQGLRTGAPDIDADGQITLDELYNYVYEQVVKETPMQTPGKWSYGQQGEMVIAQNPRPVVKPVELPPDLRQTMEDPRPWVREGAVRELDRLARGNYPGLALTAQEALKRMGEDDSRRVATAAMQALAAHEEMQGANEELKAAVVARVKAEQLVLRDAEKERLKREKAEAKRKAKEEDERLKRQRAEQEQLLRQKADAELVEQQRLDQGEARAEQLLPKIATKREFVTINIPGATWKLIFMMIAGRAIGGVIGGYIGWYYGGWAIALAISGAIEGFTIGLVLRQKELSIQRKQILLIAAAWSIVWFIGWFIDDAIVHATGEATANALYVTTGWDLAYILGIGIGGIISGAIGGAIVGLSTGLVMRQIESSIQLKQIRMITIGWAIGVAIETGFVWFIGEATKWSDAGLYFMLIVIAIAMSGIIGGAVMFSQLDQARQSK